MMHRRPRPTSSSASPPAPGILLARPSRPGEGRSLAVKDLFDTEGLVTTYGSAVFRDHVPARSAEAVVRLEGAGWVTTAKANLHEFAYGVTSQNPHFGTVPNPRAPGRVAGGSSGGSAAALAAGLCEGALGTDSGGSIRIPAAWCGVVGFKPTFGLVPMTGCFPLAPSFDHAGPLARDVATCAGMMAALAPGAPELEPVEVGSLADLRIAVAAGARLEGATEVELPLAVEVAPAFMREVAISHETIFAEHRDLYGTNVATKVERCLGVDDASYERAVAARELLRERISALLGEYDLLLTPAVAIDAPAADVDELTMREAAIRNTIPFNATGAPALALPCPGIVSGSIQVVAAPGRDSLVLAAGALLERRFSR